MDAKNTRVAMEGLRAAKEAAEFARERAETELSIVWSKINTLLMKCGQGGEGLGEMTIGER